MTEPSPEEHNPLDPAPTRRRQATSRGIQYWRSLQELAEDKDFDEIVRQEFPRMAGLLPDLRRRDFLKLMGASLAMASLAACVPQPVTKANARLMIHAPATDTL